MTKNFYYTEIDYRPDYTRFGGKINNYDFDGHTTLTEIASRIASDMNFDRRCAKNIELFRNYKNNNQKRGN